MIGIAQAQEFLLGYTPNGDYEIIARPGNCFFFVFFSENFFSFFHFLVNIDRV